MTIPFVPKGNGESCGVPIIGQAFTLKGYTLLPLLQCNCPAGELLTLVVAHQGSAMRSDPAACSHCGNRYAVQGLTMTPEGNLSFGIMTLPKGMSS